MREALLRFGTYRQVIAGSGRVLRFIGYTPALGGAHIPFHNVFRSFVVREWSVRERSCARAILLLESAAAGEFHWRS